MERKFIVQVNVNGGGWQDRGEHRKINGARAEIDRMQGARDHHRQTTKPGDGNPSLPSVSVQIVNANHDVVQKAKKLK